MFKKEIIVEVLGLVISAATFVFTVIAENKNQKNADRLAAINGEAIGKAYAETQERIKNEKKEHKEKAPKAA